MITINLYQVNKAGQEVVDLSGCQEVGGCCEPIRVN